MPALDQHDQDRAAECFAAQHGAPFDFEPTYRETVSPGMQSAPGIAWRAYAYETETIHEWQFGGDETDDPDDESLWYWDDEGDCRPTGRILAHMIGDDRTFTFDPDDLEPIEDDAYCSCCGQIGCAWG